MRIMPITNPKSVHLALKYISQETAAFNEHLSKLILKPDSYKSAKEFICSKKHLVDSWDQQLVKIFLYSTTLPPFG